MFDDWEVSNIDKLQKHDLSRPWIPLSKENLVIVENIKSKIYWAEPSGDHQFILYIYLGLK